MLISSNIVITKIDNILRKVHQCWCYSLLHGQKTYNFGNSPREDPTFLVHFRVFYTRKINKIDIVCTA